MKKRSERHKHCALAVVRWSQKFRPAPDPLPGGTTWPKFNQLEMVTTFTYGPRVWWRSMHAISSYRGNGPRDKHTNRQDWLQYTAPQSLMQCNYQITEIAAIPHCVSIKMHQIFDTQHQHTFRNDVSLQLCLSLHFYLLNLLLNSSDGNDPMLTSPSVCK